MSDRVVRGTIEGKGAAMKICLGFVPAKLELYNIDDAGALYPLVTWIRGMDGGAAGQAGGIKIKLTSGLATADFVALTATEGVAPYDGNEFLVYDGASDNRWETEAGTDQTGVVVDRNGANWGTVVCAGNTPPDKTRVRTAAGFTLGTDADINASGETVVFIAYGEA